MTLVISTTLKDKPHVQEQLANAEWTMFFWCDFFAFGLVSCIACLFFLIVFEREKSGWERRREVKVGVFWEDLGEGKEYDLNLLFEILKNN